MLLSVINSGSSGNGYVLHDEDEALVIECGCRFIDCKKVLNWNVRKIAGCIISHEHG
jgi:phosphoribosyl 1,2-cyclic phosphodiesterase